jgi:hypothetical protein
MKTDIIAVTASQEEHKNSEISVVKNLTVVC